jgi:hypothetical protein
MSPQQIQQPWVKLSCLCAAFLRLSHDTNANDVKPLPHILLPCMIVLMKSHVFS